MTTQLLETESSAGYMSAQYASALSEFGEPIALGRSGGHLLRRSIPGETEFDAICCYPLFSCRHWSLLEVDLEDLEESLVSVAAVTDPFGDYDEQRLKSCFPDLLIPFKQHFVVDLSIDPMKVISKHHLRNARKATEMVSTEICLSPADFLDEWTRLYEILINRHGIRGINAFSQKSFAKQLRVPGLVAFRAIHQKDTVGMLLWYVQGSVAYYHLGAYDECGYDLRASFALFMNAIRHFSEQGLHWLSLGSGAGVATNRRDGLTRFKQGWATGTRTAYFGGRILNRKRYADLTKNAGSPVTSYFPAYRAGEFA